MPGRMGTKVDVVFCGNALDIILNAAEFDESEGTVSGRAETDGKGEFWIASGIGTPSIGLYYPWEGTIPTEDMIKAVSERFGKGILMVIDVDLEEFAIYVAENNEVRPATILLEE